MVFSQSPSLQIFVRGETMPCADVPTYHLGPVTAIEADYIVVAYGLPHRHSGSQNFLRLNGPSKLIERSVYGCDEVRNLTGSDHMMTNIAPDNLRCQMRIDCFVVHGTIHHSFFHKPSYSKDKIG
jgi:hypothetical protein